MSGVFDGRFGIGAAVGRGIPQWSNSNFGAQAIAGVIYDLDNLSLTPGVRFKF